MHSCSMVPKKGCLYEMADLEPCQMRLFPPFVAYYEEVVGVEANLVALSFAVVLFHVHQHWSLGGIRSKWKGMIDIHQIHSCS
jgi:hypothetical protein